MPNIRSDAASGAFKSAFRVSEWSVRRKIVAVLALPVALATVFGGLRVSSELTAASNYSTTNQRAQVVGPALAYLGAVERLAMPSSLADQMNTNGAGTPAEEYTSAEEALKRAQGTSHLNGGQTGLVRAMLKLGDEIRNGTGAGIDATPSVALTNMARYTTELIDSTLNGNGIPDPRVEALNQAVNAKLSLAKQQLLIASSNQHASLLGSVWLAAEVGVEGAALDNLQALYGSPRRVSSLITANGTRLGEATSNKPSALAARPGMFTTYDVLNRHLLGHIDAQVASQASASKNRALSDSAIILLALLASLILALVMARMVINPLRRVRAGALDVANNQLPETVARIRQGREPEEITPIAVHTHEDLGQLARAVDDMHKQAVTLATGEAHLRAQVGAMFVTLSRRNTTLVNQQLALIESLEQDEEDPQRLEQLFSLDHLATRMRRTAESLVILGGNQGRTAGVEELSVSDVIHAAVSEVQDYQRVRIDTVPDRMIAARAASDVVHLMAELIDNALSYSPPGTPVMIQAAEEDGRVDIEIIDSGLGMAGDQLADANESLKRGGQVTVDTARRMGLFVVSRLAEQHGLKVKLRRNVNGGGIIASITLPADVLVSDEPVQHTSMLDAAPQEIEEPVAPVVEEEPDEDYDPYLERIEEAIAAVTGLPRRRPGLNTHAPEPVAPAAAVSMFEPAPNHELPAAYEPTPLPSQELEPTLEHVLDDTDPLSGSKGYEPIPLPAAQQVEADDEDDQDDEETLAPVVTADFGGFDATALEAGAETEPEPGAAEPSAWARATAEWARQTARSQEAEAVDAEGDLGVHEAGWSEATAPTAELDLPVPDEATEKADALGAPYAAPTDEEPTFEEPTFEEPTFEEPTFEEPTYEEPTYEEPAAYEPTYNEPAAYEPTYNEPTYTEPEPEVASFAARSFEGGPDPAYGSDEHPHEPLAPVARADSPEHTPDQAATEQPPLPVRLNIRRPLDATAAAAALEGDVPEQTETASPIFGQLRSNWLTDEPETQWVANEVDRGWDAAEQADSHDSEDRTRTGLPVRRPGGRLVPGGVSQESGPIERDPEAIRNRLAAHAAGVSRGRAAAASQPMTDDYAHEETGPA